MTNEEKILFKAELEEAINVNWLRSKDLITLHCKESLSRDFLRSRAAKQLFASGFMEGVLWRHRRRDIHGTR